MDHQFKRLLNLVRRTGDRLVVTDQNGEDTYVLMGLEAYEKIVDFQSFSDQDSWPGPHGGRGLVGDSFEEDDDNFEDDLDWEVPEEFLSKNEGGENSTLVSNEEADTKTETQNNVSSKIDNKTVVLPPETTQAVKEKDIWSTMPQAGEKTETWDVKNFNKEDKKIVEDRFGLKIDSIKDEKVEDLVVLPKDDSVSPSAPNDLEEKKDKNDPEEELFYLEPIE